MKDRLAGIVGLVLAIAYGLQARAYSSPIVSDPLGPRAFPFLLSFVLGAFCIALIVRPGSGEDNQWPDGVGWQKIVLAVAIMIVYGFILEVIGFLAASLLLVAVLSWLMGAKIVTSVATGVVSSLVLYLIFYHLFGLPLPSGSLITGVVGG